MIFSRAKAEDMKSRDLILECLKIAIRNGYTESARELGASSSKLATKIATKDYSHETPFEEDWKKKVNAGCERSGLPKIY